MSPSKILAISFFIVAQVLNFFAFAQIQENELPAELAHLFKEDRDKWEAPEEIQKNFPYYLSGFDEENRPIWVVELGKYNVRKVVEKGEKYKLVLSKYLEQAVYRIIKSIGERPQPDGDPQKECIIIYDMQGFGVDQLSSTSAIQFHIKSTRQILGAMKFVHSVFFLNVGFVARNFLRIMGPLYGSDFNKMEVHGTNAAIWRPALLRKIPRDQLPPWYGGTKEFKPVRIYG